MDWKLPLTVAAAATPLVAAGIAYNKYFKVDGAVDTTTDQHGGQLVAKVLQDHGFGLRPRTPRLTTAQRQAHLHPGWRTHLPDSRGLRGVGHPRGGHPP
jgi:hypothetical protein